MQSSTYAAPCLQDGVEISVDMLRLLFADNAGAEDFPARRIEHQDCPDMQLAFIRTS